MSMGEHTVLVLGGSKSGKTLYGAQLTIRLMKNPGALRFYAQPDNLELFDEPMQLLGRGRLSKHTPFGVNKDVVLPIELPKGNRVRVVWPDYGGEQVTQMLRGRTVSAGWRDRTVTSDGWLLMVRPELFRESRDLLHRPLKDIQPKDVSDGLPEWVPEAGVVELLQILLFIRRLGRETRIRNPKLAVGITCWDEWHASIKSGVPHEELRRLAPMLLNFVEALWEPSCVTVFGISSLGKALSADVDDEQFVDEGAHRQGFIVLPSGKKSDDLTWPLAKLLE